MSQRSGKPKKAFYALTDDGDFKQRHQPLGDDVSDDDSPGGEDPTLAWGSGTTTTTTTTSPTTPEALRKYPVVDDGVVKVRRIKSKALQRLPSSTSNGSHDSSAEEIVIGEQRKPKVKKRVKDKTKDQMQAVEMQSGEFRKNSGRAWGAFSNLSFSENDEDSINSDFEDIFLGLAKSVKETEQNMEKWEELQAAILANKEQVHQEIEKRKKKMIKRMKDHAQILHERLDAMIDPHLDTTNHQIETMHEAMDEANKLSDGTFINQHHIHGNVNRSRESLAGLCARMEKGATEAPRWQEVRLLKTENSHQLITGLFGDLQGGASAPGVVGDGMVVEGKEKQKGTGGVLDEFVFQGSFNTKAPKDSRECGITDIAVTPSNQILVVDKHNKLVKLFTAEGRLERYIGRGLLKEPSRVSVLRSNGHILVTDVAAKCVRVFHRDGAHVGEFIPDLKFPISCCELADGRVVVLEYATRTIRVYDSGARAVHSFATEMENPAYMGCSVGGHIVLTDWRHNHTRIFDITGAKVWEFKGQGSAEDEMKLPHGCCGDGHGNFIFAEKGNARVQIYNENGDHVRCFKPTRKEEMFKLPYAVDTNHCELMAVAEYQGVVKLFRYIDVPFSSMDSSSSKGKKKQNKPGGRKSSIVPEDVKVERRLADKGCKK